MKRITGIEGGLAARFSVLAAFVVLAVGLPYAGQPEANNDALLKEYLGKVLVVEVGQIGCGLSGRYLFTLQRLYPELKKLGAEVLRVDVFADEGASKKYREKNKIPFAHRSDPKGKLAKELGARLMPTLLVIDKFGNVRFSGGLKEAELKERIKKLAAEKEPPTDIASGPAFKSGDAAPVFTAGTLEGEEFDLKKVAAANKFTAVFFHSLFCPFSRQAVEQFEALALECLEGEGIKLAIVNLEDNVRRIKAVLKIGDPSISVIPDKGGEIRKLYKVEGAPFSAIIGKDGKFVYYGEFSGQKFREILGLEPAEPEESSFKDVFAFNGETITGEKFDFAEYIKKHKATILMFVGAEDDLDRMYVEELFDWLKKGGWTGIAVVAVDASEDVEAAKKYYDEKKFDMKVIRDKDGSISEKSGVEMTPYYFLVSPGGKIACDGEMSLDQWKYFINLMLNGKPLKPYVEESPSWG